MNAVYRDKLSKEGILQGLLSPRDTLFKGPNLQERYHPRCKHAYFKGFITWRTHLSSDAVLIGCVTWMMLFLEDESLA
jgi:hypothetical protein